ncbi:DNA polymerase I [Erysipelothrix urinaevulpis]|uniref:DNA polymerase I n=1 Tax=Erysipelothrix urinaevulpis TaxID=2683717 RepID=UPI00135938E2|nr:DNA polymerase I [Erysipelothrix urinaevulpis]
MKKILLLDGNSMLFRAYYGTLSRGHMRSKEGHVTNAVYGFSTMLNKAIEIMEPSHIVVAFDTKDKTFRHDLFEDYKGTRKEVDPELVSQFELVREFLDEYPVKRIELSGYEADDLIGTISKMFPNDKIEILTSDQDMLQLIDEHVDVVLMKKGLTNLQVMNPTTMLEEKGYRPDQVVDIKALMGDASDNIPGVPSIGEKTALKLINQYESFEGVYNHADEVKGKMGEKLREFEDQARLSYQLAKINCEVPIEFDIDDYLYEKPSETLNAFYRRYDMNSLIVEDTIVDKDEKIELMESTLDKTWLNHPTSLIMDVDKKGELNGAYLAANNKSCYLNYLEMTSSSLFHEILATNPLITLHSKHLYRFALEYQLSLNSSIEDVLLLAFIIDPSITTLARLQDEYEFWFHEFEGDQKGLAMVTQLQGLYETMSMKAKEDDLTSLYDDIEKPLTSVLALSEHYGIHVDLNVLDEIADKTAAKIADLTDEIYRLAGTEFNVNSPKQLAEILFDTLELPMVKKRSTAVAVLEELEDKHPIITPILDYRKYQKLYSTYAHGLKKYVQSDGKIHTTFNQHATQTGRLSSSDPNLQNISVRDEETRQIRRAFVASDDSYLVSIDYSQIELRVLAFLAREEKMIEAFNADLDIHTKTAQEIFMAESVDSEMRRQAKSINFGIVYGMSPYGLSKQLDIPIKQASEFIKAYNDVYPGIQGYMDTLVESCKKEGYVTTHFGRRRYIPEIYSSNRANAQFGERAAMNAPIQGTAADIIKMAMIKTAKIIEDKGFKSRMILQVHDELVFDVLESEKDEFIELMVDAMETIVDWDVKMKVSVSVGKNWMEDLNA